MDSRSSELKLRTLYVKIFTHFSLYSINVMDLLSVVLYVRVTSMPK